MNTVPELHKKIGEYYTDHIAEYEKIRLELDSPVEYALTLRILSKFIKDKAVVADIGVGFGHYTEHLASRGCRLHLADVTQVFLRATEDRLKKSGLSNAIISCNYASAVDLSFIDQASVDAVLMLGPLYHLCDEAERRQAIAEAHRILKPGGKLIASAINRLGYFRELFNTERFFHHQKLFSLTEYREMLMDYQKTGNLSPQLFCCFGRFSFGDNRRVKI